MQELHITTSFYLFFNLPPKTKNPQPRNKLSLVKGQCHTLWFLFLYTTCFALEAWYIKISKPVQLIHPPFVHYWEYHSSPQDD